MGFALGHERSGLAVGLILCLSTSIAVFVFVRFHHGAKTPWAVSMLGVSASHVVESQAMPALLPVAGIAELQTGALLAPRVAELPRLP